MDFYQEKIKPRSPKSKNINLSFQRKNIGENLKHYFF